MRGAIADRSQAWRLSLPSPPPPAHSEHPSVPLHLPGERVLWHLCSWRKCPSVQAGVGAPCRLGSCPYSSRGSRGPSSTQNSPPGGGGPTSTAKRGPRSLQGQVQAALPGPAGTLFPGVSPLLFWVQEAALQMPLTHRGLCQGTFCFEGVVGPPPPPAALHSDSQTQGGELGSEQLTGRSSGWGGVWALCPVLSQGDGGGDDIGSQELILPSQRASGVELDL